MPRRYHRRRNMRDTPAGWFLWTCGVVLFSSTVLLSCRNRPVDQTPQGGASRTDMFSQSEAYERFMGRWSRRLAPVFLEFTDLMSAESVLDVGSGTGALTSSVLATRKPRQVVGVDPSAAYVDYARTRTADARASFEVGDGQQLRFADDSFDATISLLVINFIPNPDKALSEMIRVTRPRGVVAAAVWDYDQGMEMLRIFWDEAVALDPSSEARDERHMSFSGSGELSKLWRGHGLVDVQETALVIPMTFESFDDFWLPFLEGQGPAGAHVASLSVEARSQLEQRLRQRLQVQTGGAVNLSGRAWAVRGVVAK